MDSAHAPHPARVFWRRRRRVWEATQTFHVPPLRSLGGAAHVAAVAGVLEDVAASVARR